ncbi:putative reverse transcriptase domain-containing protein [Tanacetum coccineum]|uniref:Reverse transcriptase domain-containing protein n=1 Tax=Tanacetum coccineum TaxID=301880 RepID=A0ABQ4WBT8_9ASTR
MAYFKDDDEEEEEEVTRDEEEMEEDMMLMIHRVEDMAVAPTPDDHEQEAEANTVGTITRVPLLCALFLAVLLVGSGPSRQVFAPWPKEGMSTTYIAKHYRERPYVAPTAPVAHVDRADPDDHSPRPTRRPRHDDPYVMSLYFAITKPGIIMPPRAMTQAAIEKLVSDRVAAALAQDRATRGNTNGAGGPGGNIGGNAGGQGGAPPARECTYSSFMKCNPTSFHGNEGAVELSRWFEKTESVFSISECAERNKVKFAAATLQGRALTWWNSQVATLGLEVVNAKSWNDMKIMMREEFCPPEEIQRMEVELWNLRVKDSNISAYTQRFNELVLLCPEMVPSEKKKVEAYLRGLPENIKGETTSSRPVVLNEAVQMAHTLMEQKL